MEDIRLSEEYKEKIAAFGQLIKEKRTERDLSLSDVAEQTGVGKAYISRLERGDRDNPSFIIVYTLCEFFDIDIRSILKTVA